MPKRIQRKRTRGWRMPEGAIYVGRPTKWGNRYIIGETVEHVDSKLHHVKDAAAAKRLFAEWFEWQCQRFPSWRHSIKLELGGHNLACWCRLEDQYGNYSPCHADVLLKIANEH